MHHNGLATRLTSPPKTSSWIKGVVPREGETVNEKRWEGGGEGRRDNKKVRKKGMERE